MPSGNQRHEKATRKGTRTHEHSLSVRDTARRRTATVDAKSINFAALCMVNFHGFVSAPHPCRRDATSIGLRACTEQYLHDNFRINVGNQPERLQGLRPRNPVTGILFIREKLNGPQKSKKRELYPIVPKGAIAHIP